MLSVKGIPNPTGEKKSPVGKGEGEGEMEKEGRKKRERETLKKMCAQSNKASWDM